MRNEQSVQNQRENTASSQKQDTGKQARPADRGGQVQFKILMAIIAFGVLMLILKALGIA